MTVTLPSKATVPIEQAVEELFHRGLSPDKITAELGIMPGVVYYWLNQLDYVYTPNFRTVRLPDDHKLLLLNMRKNGRTWRYCAKKLGYSVVVVQRIHADLEKTGWQRPPAKLNRLDEPIGPPIIPEKRHTKTELARWHECKKDACRVADMRWDGRRPESIEHATGITPERQQELLTLYTEMTGCKHSRDQVIETENEKCTSL